jgi:dTDP-4-dehydrorhamnose reductase
MAKILVLGAYGFLGINLTRYLESQGHVVLRHGRNIDAQFSFDATNEKSLGVILNLHQPNFVINLVAMTDVEGCEKNPEQAYRENIAPVEGLFKYADRINFHLIHISTDQVYSGTGFHSEDTVSPCNVYGVTKLQAELVAREIDATVLRINYVGRSEIKNRQTFTDWIVNALKNHEKVTFYQNIFFNPLHISSLSNFIGRVLDCPFPGIYNLGARSSISKAKFAITLAELLGLDTRNTIVGDYCHSAFQVKRPLDMSMNVASFEKKFGILLPEISDTINRTALDYQ